MRQALLSVVVGAAMVAGCGGTSGPSTVAVTSTQTVTTTHTASAPVTPVRIPWPPAGLGVDQTPVLRTPSGNIECVLSEELGVVCAARRHSWTLPPKPASCDLEWTDGIALAPTGRPQFRCAGDPAFGPENRYWPRTRLPYDALVASGGVECTSRTAGVTCTNREGHGFFLSRQLVRFF